MRLRFDLAYDGSGFHGWAKQTDLRTVQEEVEKALDTVLRSSGTTLTVAGRTDTGVHARGQVAHADVDPDVGGRSSRTQPRADDGCVAPAAQRRPGRGHPHPPPDRGT